MTISDDQRAAAPECDIERIYRFFAQNVVHLRHLKDPKRLGTHVVPPFLVCDRDAVRLKHGPHRVQNVRAVYMHHGRRRHAVRFTKEVVVRGIRCPPLAPFILYFVSWNLKHLSVSNSSSRQRILYGNGEVTVTLA